MMNGKFFYLKNKGFQSLYHQEDDESWTTYRYIDESSSSR